MPIIITLANGVEEVIPNGTQIFERGHFLEILGPPLGARKPSVLRTIQRDQIRMARREGEGLGPKFVTGDAKPPNEENSK
jgi:hypothetical protein